MEEKFEELAARTQVFASLDTIVQMLVIITQLSLTGYIATRLGVIALLVTIPVVMVFGLTVYAAFGTFSVMAAAMVLRRWGEYAFIRPGREMLFSKVDKESKYKAKNVCDVAVYRIADAGFAQIKKLLDGIGMGGTAQALTAAAVAALWAINGWWLGRRFEKEKAPEAGIVHRNRAGRNRARRASEFTPMHGRARNSRLAAASLDHALERHPFLSVRPVDQHLDLVFVSGRRYRYHDVPDETYDAMRRAFSKGEFFNAYIRDQYRHTLRELTRGSGRISGDRGVGSLLLVRQRDAEARVFAGLGRDADAAAGLVHEVAHHVHADAARAPSPTVVKPGPEDQAGELARIDARRGVGASARPGARPRRESCRDRARGRRPAR